MSVMAKRNSGSSWGYLPEHLLDMVLDHLISASDYVRFSVVCKRWLSAARFHRMEWRPKSSPKHHLPMLLIPTDDASETHRIMCSVAGKELVNYNKLLLHVPCNRRCCGSSHGWLIFAQDNLALTLFNPFTGAAIHLPPLTGVPTGEDPEYDIQKVVLSEDPGLFPDTYQVLALHEYMGYIYLFRSGSDSWIHVERTNTLISYNPLVEDVIYYQGKFFLAASELLISVETSASGYYLKLRKVPVQADSAQLQKFYLVESSYGDLLYVGRVYIHDETRNPRDRLPMISEPLGYIKIDHSIHEYRNSYASLTKKFLVYKLMNLDRNDDQVMYVELKSSLGGESLFLGSSHSLSILASDFARCQPDCIYYTDDEFTIMPREHGGIDIGVFDFNNFDDGGQRHAKHLYATAEEHIHLPPPIWIVPQPSFSSL